MADGVYLPRFGAKTGKTDNRSSISPIIKIEILTTMSSKCRKKSRFFISEFLAQKIQADITL